MEKTPENRELVILNAIAQALNREVDLDQALQATLEKSAELLGLHSGWIWLLDDETGDPYLAAVLNLPPALADHPRRMAGTCYCLDTFRAGDMEGAANVNVITCSRLQWLSGDTRGLKYHASIPLYAHGKKSGVMNVASPDWRELSGEDLRLLYTVGDMLSIAIERARLFARSVELGASEERNRLAREIHDTLAQGLAGISLQLEAAELLLQNGADSRRVQALLQRTLDLAQTNLEEARRSVLDLRAASLEGKTLPEALEKLVQEYVLGSRTEIKFESVGGNRRLPVRIETGLYRVAQEALANIVQHSAARHASLDLELTPSLARLRVKDDGTGFDPGRLPRGRYGLTGIQERVKLLKGDLRIQSEVGVGTEIDATVPIIPRLGSRGGKA
ncbi:MAG TPA: GAF domain-containing sensor histidine kinase [Anaerolineaceae bacterium]|nr:GAF domain-containing sensor histidine kinase [Anaerolineaceae bacterium]